MEEALKIQGAQQQQQHLRLRSAQEAEAPILQALRPQLSQRRLVVEIPAEGLHRPQAAEEILKRLRITDNMKIGILFFLICLVGIMIIINLGIIAYLSTDETNSRDAGIKMIASESHDFGRYQSAS